MRRSREILFGALSVSTLATIFCVWTALGNDVNFCVTTGCSLYQDFSIGGFSLWWLGVAVFALLAALALLGAAGIGRALSGLALLTDMGLLLLMAFTAPCTSCLVVAFFFAVVYLCFRHAVHARAGQHMPRRSLILLCWLLLFAVNLGAVARSQLGVWPIMDAGEDVRTRLFFSPSCPSCRTAVEKLSGRVDVGFYPLAEDDSDIARVARMRDLLEQGQNPAQALQGVQELPADGPGLFSPAMLWLRFRLLCNKAHVFASDTQAVPFVEFHGLPAFLADKTRTENVTPPEKQRPTPEYPVGLDHSLPLETLEPLVSGRCGDASAPCP